MLLTAPQLASVVTVANRADPAIPKRVSLPSMFPPACKAVAPLSTPSFARIGLPACSAGYATKTPIRNITDMAANSAQPWRGVLHHGAERIGQSGAEHEDQQDLNEVREGGRALERMCRVAVEETAAI